MVTVPITFNNTLIDEAHGELDRPFKPTPRMTFSFEDDDTKIEGSAINTAALRRALIKMLYHLNEVGNEQLDHH